MAQPLRQPSQSNQLRPIQTGPREAPDLSREAFYGTYRLMQAGFVIAPLVAGVDKFFNVLVDWPIYLASIVPQTLNMTAQGFMYLVGVVEIVAAIGVALKPRIFGYVVSAWLTGIVMNLVIAGGYWDIALRDVGLAISAFSLARLARFFDTKKLRAS